MSSSQVRYLCALICLAITAEILASPPPKQASATPVAEGELQRCGYGDSLQDGLCAATPPADCVSSNSIRLLCDQPQSRNWLTLEFATFWNDGYRVPELVTTSPAGTPRAQAGVLGLPATSTLLGNTTVSDDSLSGLNLEFGHWLDDCGRTALVGSFFFAHNGGQTEIYPGDANTIVSRPFFNASPAVNSQDAELVNFPGVVNGTITVDAESEFFTGGIGIQKQFQCCVDRGCCTARGTSVYMGYRTFWLDEDLVISETLLPTSALLPAGTQIDVLDQFSTQNRFHGVEVGFNRSWQKQRWLFELQSRYAIGNIYQRVTIDGSTTTTVSGLAPAVQPYGVLATPSNIGQYDRNRFGYVVDSRLELGYQLSRRWILKLGYNVMFLSDVARPGRYVDPVVNATLIDPNVPDAGPARPAFRWADSESALLHGLRLGAEFQF